MRSVDDASVPPVMSESSTPLSALCRRWRSTIRFAVVASPPGATSDSSTPLSASRWRYVVNAAPPFLRCIASDSEHSDSSSVPSRQQEPWPDQRLTGAESLHSLHNICHLYSGLGYGYGHSHPIRRLVGNRDGTSGICDHHCPNNHSCPLTPNTVRLYSISMDMPDITRWSRHQMSPVPSHQITFIQELDFTSSVSVNSSLPPLLG